MGRPEGRSEQERGRPGVALSRGEGVVRTLAVHFADRVDGRQIQHVESHRRDSRQALGRGAERAALDGPVLQTLGPFGAGEELVPGADAGPLAFDEELLRPAGRGEARHRALPEERGDRRVTDDDQSLLVGRRLIAQGGRGAGERAALRRGAVLLGGGGGQQQRAHLAHERAVHAGRDLEFGGVLPCRVIVRERLEAEGPDTLLQRRHLHLPPIEPVTERRQPVQR